MSEHKLIDGQWFTVIETEEGIQHIPIIWPTAEKFAKLKEALLKPHDGCCQFPAECKTPEPDSEGIS